MSETRHRRSGDVEGKTNDGADRRADRAAEGPRHPC